MATYNPTTNFTAKDALAAGDPNKIIRGADFGVEFDAISTAINAVPDSPFVNVKDYGALGDGVADDTAAIQSAINYASANGIQTVLIPDGHYRYTTLRMYHEATDNPNFQESPNRDGKIRLLGHGRFSNNDLKTFDPTTRGVYGTFLEGIAGGEGIIVDPTDAFDDQDSRNFVMEHMTVTANNTGYVIVNRQCPEFTLVNVAIKQVNYLGNGILNRNAWFTNIENCAIFGPSTETNTPEEPDNNTGDGIVGETDFFAGEFNIHNSLIDSWANGFKWNAGQFVNVALRDTAVQNCNNYNIYGLAGTIFNLLLDNVYFENQSTQGVSFIKSVDDCFRAVKMTNCFMLAGNGGVARVSSHCIDLDNPDAIHIDNMYVFRPRQTFLNVTATRNLQNVSGEIKNSMFLTDEDLSAEPTVYLLDGILPNVHNCVWPTMSQGVHNTTGDVRLYDESVYGKYLRSFTDVTGTTAHSKFSYGDTEQVTVATAPYRMTGAGIEQKAYYDLTHAISAGLAVYLPAPASVKTDGRVVIVRNNENSTSASNYPFINVFISTGVPPSTGFLVQLAPSEAAMFVFDGKGTNGGDFKCVGKWSDSGADYTINADTGSEEFQSGYESLRFTGGTGISTAVTSPSFGEDEVTISLDTSGDIAFGDNEKAIFGAGSDLQIYHDGSNSYIRENGTGDLLIGATNFQIRDSSLGEQLLTAVTNGAVNLYYDNSLKLATTSTGIDVTGAVTASGNVGIGTSTPSYDLEIEGASKEIRITDTGTNDTYARMATENNSATLQVGRQGANFSTGSLVAKGNASYLELDNLVSRKGLIETDGAGDLFISIDDGTTKQEFMKFDYSSGNVGIGNNTPAYKLDLLGSDAAIRVDNTAGLPDQTLMLFQADMGTNDRNMQIKSPATDSASAPFRFTTANSFAFEIDSNASALVIDSNANVGIGTETPSADLDVNGVFTVDVANEDAVITGATPALEFVENDSGGSKMRMAWNTSVGFSPTMYQSLYGDTTSTYGSINIQTRASDASGNQVVYAYDSINDRNWWGTRTAGDVAMQLTSDGTFNVRGGDVVFEDSSLVDKFVWDASASALGVGIAAPARTLHISDVMRLEPSATPSSPSAGDVYYDSTTNKLRCYNGTTWNDLF